MTATPPASAYFARATVAEICVSGYTKRVRHVPYRVRDRIYDAAGLPRHHRQGWVIDHVVSLELGGTNALSNLIPQSIVESYVKDREENRLHMAVCDGTLSLSAAKNRIYSDWYPRERKDIWRVKH